MEVDIYAGRPCILVARYFYRHASSKFHSTHKGPVFVIPFRRLTCHHNALLCLSSRIQENILHTDSDAGTRMIKVKFILRRRCEFGQQFYVIGDNKILGGWAPEAAIPMQWSEGHVWTLQLDLLSGTYVEFKVLLKADQDVLEWQPGPNGKLKVSDGISPLLAFVPWLDGDNTLEKEAPRILEMHDLPRTQDDVEFASSVRSPSDVVNNVGDAITSLDVINEPKTEERSADNETVISNAKDVVEEKQAGAKGRITGDRGLIDKGTHSNSKPSGNFLSLYPVPESWYVEESSDIHASRKITEPSPGLLEINEMVGPPTTADEILANKEDKAGKKPPLWDTANELIAEGESEEANGEYGTGLSYTELEDIDEKSAQEVPTQDGPNEAFVEPQMDFIVEPAVLQKEEPTADEIIMVHKDSNEASLKAAADTPAQNELPGSEVSNEPNETVETKSAKDKRWGRKGWSKLWGAIVQGRIG